MKLAASRASHVEDGRLPHDLAVSLDDVTGGVVAKKSLVRQDRFAAPVDARADDSEAFSVAGLVRSNDE